MVSKALLHDRIEHRRGHYMPPSLLGSQLSTLEPLQSDEPGIGVSGDGPPDVVAGQILATLSSRDSGDNPQERTSP
jgi:gluconokinase